MVGSPLAGSETEASLLTAPMGVRRGRRAKTGSEELSAAACPTEPQTRQSATVLGASGAWRWTEPTSSHPSKTARAKMRTGRLVMLPFQRGGCSQPLDSELLPLVILGR